jgi:predicted nucleotidyltransferase
MSYHNLGAAISDVVFWLETNKINYALVGGLAVSFRTTERATKDIDFVIAVKNDLESEEIIRSLNDLEYKPSILLENNKHKIISTVRLLSPKYPGVYLDILFNTSGIEYEISEEAETIEILKNVPVKVAKISSLIAMKILSSTNKKRRQDLIDLENLISEASKEELHRAEALIRLIQEREFNEDKDLIKIYKNLIAEIK